MGLLRSIAKRILGRTDGPSGGAVLPTAPSPATPPVADGASMANIECGPQELRERLEAGETMTLVDVREPFETASGLIPGAIEIPLRELSTRWEELKSADEIVCYCASGARSYNAAMLLRKNGLINATSLEGGITAWRAIGAETTASNS
jgi:rhodanese-related sulfurtransferase